MERGTFFLNQVTDTFGVQAVSPNKPQENFLGIAFPVEKGNPPDPLNIFLLSSVGKMLSRYSFNRLLTGL